MHTKSRNKISMLLKTELFYSYILNTNLGSLHTRSSRGINVSIFENRLTKNGFTGPKRSRSFRETGPRARTQTVRSQEERANMRSSRLSVSLVNTKQYFKKCELILIDYEKFRFLVKHEISFLQSQSTHKLFN